MAKKLVEKDITILKLLRENSRISLTDIARKTNLRVSTIHYIFCKLKRRGIIEKKTTLLDWNELGYGIRVNIVFRAKQKKELIEFLKENRNVNSVFMINKNGEFFIDTIFQSMKEVYDFLENLNNFKLKFLREYHIIDNIIEEKFYTS